MLLEDNLYVTAEIYRVLTFASPTRILNQIGSEEKPAYPIFLILSLLQMVLKHLFNSFFLESKEVPY